MKAVVGSDHIKDKYTVIEHTADTGIVVEAKTLEELFAVSGCAMFDLMVDVTKVEPAEEAKVSLEADSIEELLIHWLNELLFRSEISGMFFSRFEVSSIRNNALKAQVMGEPYNQKKHEIGQGIKAATYHELEVSRKNRHWFAKVIFDI
jgi:SHS2 domain-containing protein